MKLLFLLAKPNQPLGKQCYSQAQNMVKRGVYVEKNCDFMEISFLYTYMVVVWENEKAPFVDGRGGILPSPIIRHAYKVWPAENSRSKITPNVCYWPSYKYCFDAFVSLTWQSELSKPVDTRLNQTPSLTFYSPSQNWHKEGGKKSEGECLTLHGINQFGSP